MVEQEIQRLRAELDHINLVISLVLHQCGGAQNARKNLSPQKFKDLNDMWTLELQLSCMCNDMVESRWTKLSATT